jgi:chromosomal replication initiator protein
MVVHQEKPDINTASPLEEENKADVGSSLMPSFLKKKPKSGKELNPKYTFDDFIIGPSNNFAQAAARAVAEQPAKAYNPLFIYGGVGLGKTHLMQAIGHNILGRGKKHVLYLSTEEFTNEYIDALQNRSLVNFRKKYRNIDLLLIDDIHFLAGKERMQEEFFHTFNALFDAHKQIVMTCDRPASEIPGLEQRLVSRFEWGLVVEMEQPDLETRLAILKTKLRQADVSLSEDVLLYIAQNIKSNIRRLEGALIRVISYSSLTGRDISVSSLERLLHDTLDQEKEAAVTFDTIMKAVAEYYDVRLADMSSTRRQRSVAKPRQVAMFLCRKMTTASLPDIGEAFGKTHATVLHAYRAIGKRADEDDLLKRDILSIADTMGKKVTF